MGTLLVLAHGIGETPANFHEAWETKIRADLGQTMNGVTVKGLWWEDVLQKVEDRFPPVEGSFGSMIAKFGHDELRNLLDNANWKTFQTYMMDVLVYVGLKDMWQYILGECTKKLRLLRLDARGSELFAERDTILVGHSLGAGMLPQLAWREYVATGTIAYKGMLLLASPLGFESPLPAVCQDFLQRLGEMYGGDRLSTIKAFARAWTLGGPHRLKFVSNANDIVCSDVEFDLPLLGKVDPIPVRQGFRQTEIDLLNKEHADSFQSVSFGNPSLASIAANHDVFTYLDQDAFKIGLQLMLP